MKGSPAPCAAFSDWLAGVGRSVEPRAHWLFCGEESGSAERPNPAGLAWVECVGSALCLSSGLRHWAREDGAGWLPGELLTSVRPGGFASGEPTSAALCLSEPLSQRYGRTRAHIRWRRPPRGLCRRSELGIWRPPVSSHPLLLPVSYPDVSRQRWRWGQGYMGVGVGEGRLLFFPQTLSS